MKDRKKIQKQPESEVTNNASDAEFGIEYTHSKKERKKAGKNDEKK